MDKKIFLNITAFLFSVALYAQPISTVDVKYVTGDGTKDNNIIYYQSGQSLHWDDFKGKPVAGSDAVALTSAGFGVKLNFRRKGDNSQLEILVSCSFSKKDSWVFPENKNAYILNHEQKHFDLAYINTLVFIRHLKEAHFTLSNYAALIEKIYNETALEMTKVQDQYDTETSHSRIPEKQAQWDEKIAGQLTSDEKN